MTGDAMFNALKTMLIAWLSPELATTKDSTLLMVPGIIWLCALALEASAILLDWWRAR